MLTRIFGSNSIFSLGVLILLTVVLWSKMFCTENAFIGYIPASPFYNVLVTYLGDFVIINSFIAIVLVLLQALLINNLLSGNDLMPGKTYMGAFIFILFTASFSDIVVLHPIIFSGFIMTIVLNNLFKLYEKNEGYALVFNTSMLVSFASMFYFPAIVFIFFIWACFIVYRILAWREWFISLIGFGLPYLFLGTYYFWNDKLPLKINEYAHAIQVINFYDFKPTFNTYIFISLIGFILLMAVFFMIKLISEKAIRIRKLLSLIIWLFVISYLSMVISPLYGIIGFVMLLVPASVIVALYISNMRKSIRNEIILILITIIVAFSRLDIFELIK
ncbi:MAG TPA: hypothetical protein PKK00_00880 [Bacteroidales bacterium]|nr:hypothetical protein [Bacteroidales bacterium]HPS15937.1 hypothetical protein [Bacteroidales bacterium]